jgi:hypothetical protein
MGKTNGLRGPKPKRRGAVIKGTRVISQTIYPRPTTKKVIVDAAKAAGLSVSNFVLKGAVILAAKESKTTPLELLPEDEYGALFERTWTQRK